MSPPCPICDDTGWKSIPAEPGQKAAQAVRCECRVASRAERLLTQARIPKRYEHCTLENFLTSFDGATADLPAARLMAESFVNEYPADGKGLLFLGDIGVGKTHLAVGALRDLVLQRNAQCLFCDYRELLKQIQNSYNTSVNTTELEILQPVFDAEVLVLDELGAVKPTEWVWDTVSLILNSRYNDKRTTIITTNFPNAPAAGVAQSALSRVSREESLGDRIGERMRSRLYEMCRIIEIHGPDFRPRAKELRPHTWRLRERIKN